MPEKEMPAVILVPMYIWRELELIGARTGERPNEVAFRLIWQAKGCSFCSDETHV
jgi:hypothetical protein